MENLKYYSLKLGFDSDNHAYAQMMLNKNGDYVKRSDNEKALRSASENIALLVKVADYYRRNFIKGIGGQAGVVGVLLEVIAQRY